MAVAVSNKLKATGQAWAGGNYSAAQTNLELVADPGDGRAVFVDYIHVSTAGANVVELRDGTGGTAVYRDNFGAAGYESNAFPAPIGITASTGLFLNTTYAGAHQVQVLYHIENFAVS